MNQSLLYDLQINSMKECGDDKIQVMSIILCRANLFVRARISELVVVHGGSLVASLCYVGGILEPRVLLILDKIRESYADRILQCFFNSTSGSLHLSIYGISLDYE